MISGRGGAVAVTIGSVPGSTGRAAADSGGEAVVATEERRSRNDREGGLVGRGIRVRGCRYRIGGDRGPIYSRVTGAASAPVGGSDGDIDRIPLLGGIGVGASPRTVSDARRP